MRSVRPQKLAAVEIVLILALTLHRVPAQPNVWLNNTELYAHVLKELRVIRL